MVKPFPSIVESGRVTGVGLVSRGSGRGELPYTLTTPMSRPIFGRSLYAETSLQLIKVSRFFRPRGTLLERPCKEKLANGHTWHSSNVIPSGHTSLIFMPCPLLPRQWSGLTKLILFKTSLTFRVSGFGRQKS
jgi:hypothetical protein